MAGTDIKDKAGCLKAIDSGKGIQYILDEAYKILMNPILIHDMDYNFVACSDNMGNDDPIWNELLNDGKIGEETIRFITDEGFVDDVANSTLQNGITYLISDKLKYDRIFGQLYNKNQLPVADLILLESETPFLDGTPELIKILCDIISSELVANEYYLEYGRRCQENTIKMLLENRINDNQIYTAYIANIDKHLKKNIFTAVADVTRCNNSASGLEYYRELLEKACPAFEYYLFYDSVIILLSSDKDTLGDDDSLNKLAELFECENIYAGVSSSFDNLFNLRNYYDEAKAALLWGMKTGGRKHIFMFEEMKTGQI